MAGLNPSQSAAVEHDLGPLLVLAGAGSGKTRVVTSRIARLLERGVHARSILAMTFTNKAALEMQERVARIVGAKVVKDLTVSTFHSFGLSVIASEGKSLGLRDGRFTIFDQSDVVGAVREILRTVAGNRRYDIGAILARMSKAKNEFLEPDALEEREADDYDEITKIVYPRYLAALRSFSAFDFDDLVCEPVRLWKRRPDVLERWRERYRYMLVDEYQDTNHAQLEMVRLLGGGHQNVCVVGDDDQSIYAWRGADVSNILDFEAHFPGAKVVKLEENYRSTASVLAVASAVLSKSQARRHAKSVRAVRPEGAKVQVVVAADPDVEASFIADEIRRLRETGARLEECAILYRSNLQSEPIEAALKDKGIPFRLVGGTQFYDRKEIKDLIAYLNVALNPRDEISLRRVINYPARGIGEGALARLETAALARDLPLWEAVRKAEAIDGLAKSAVDACHAFVHIVSEARHEIDQGTASAEVARRLAEAVGLRDDVFAGSGSNVVATRRWGNVESLFAVLARWEARKGGPSPKRLAELLRILSLGSDDDESEGEKDKKNVVTLSTMHGAKGLEYENVFLAGLEEGLMPHQRTLEPKATDVGGKEAADVEEERRLFYVSITRAKNQLWLCRTKYRAMRGKPVPRTPSRFLADIPPELVETREVAAKIALSTSETGARAAAVLDLLKSLSDSSAGPVKRPGF